MANEWLLRCIGLNPLIWSDHFNVLQCMRNAYYLVHKRLNWIWVVQIDCDWNAEQSHRAIQVVIVNNVSHISFAVPRILYANGGWCRRADSNSIWPWRSFWRNFRYWACISTIHRAQNASKLSLPFRQIEKKNIILYSSVLRNALSYC